MGDGQSYISATSGSGQVLHLLCEPGKEGDIRAAIAMAHEISVPVAGPVSEMGHGCYASYSRYQMTQHGYGGGQDEVGGAYTEVLEIHSPPDGRCGVVIHQARYGSCSGGPGHTFWEFADVDAAVAAFEAREFSKGCLREVQCGHLTPWFYAVGNEHLVGDFALACGLEDDPVYRLGCLCRVPSGKGGQSVIKTCMGTRYTEEKVRDFTHGHLTDGIRHYRLICFHDGTMWDEFERRHSGQIPYLPEVV